jgi:hypothetical protein
LKIFGLFGITVAASAGLCGAALAFSPGAAAAPLPTGGPTCQMLGLGAPVAAAPPAPVVLPGPPVVPAGAPVPAGVPAGPPVAAGAPAGAPVAPAGAPLLQQAGGKGVPTNPEPALTAGPVVLPGPPAPTPLPPVPVTGPTLVAATGPVPPCCNP